MEFNTLDGRIISQRMQPVAAGTDSSGGCIWFHHDVTLERQTQQRAWQALRDPLTKLMNRRGLYETLQAAIAAAARNHSSVALMFVDLDDFKHANDLGGHRTGDEILVAVGRALSGQLRRGETVARLGGDEFAVLSPGVTAAEAAAIAARLVGAVSRLVTSFSGTASMPGRASRWSARPLSLWGSTTATRSGCSRASWARDWA